METCPQYLLLNEDKYQLSGFESAKYVCSPPLRSRGDSAALWQALAAGEIDVMSTDHCSFDFDGPKQLGREDFSAIPNGMPGVETRPVLLYTYGVAAGRLTLTQFVHLLAEEPAKLFGMYPRKGVLAVGSDADIVIWDPAWTGTISAATQLQNVDYSPFEGFPVAGRADTVLLLGETAVEGGRVVDSGLGRYVSRGPSLGTRRL